MLIRVENGTRAGLKRDKAARPQPWVHVCPPQQGHPEYRETDTIPVSKSLYRQLAAHWTICPDCGCPRPKA